MNRNVIIVVVLVVLVLITAVQAIQLNSLKSNIATGKVSVASGKAPVQGNTVASSGGLEDLPSMVGGC